MDKIIPFNINFKHNDNLKKQADTIKPMENNEKAELIQSFENVHSLKEAYASISASLAQKPEFKEIGLNLFKYKDYYIKTGKKLNLEAEAKNLKAIQPYNLTSAPELISAIELENGQDMVLITKINGTKDKEPEKYSITKTNASMQAKKQLLEDFDKLMADGLYNPAIIESTKNWMYIQNTDTIYIDDWSRLKITADKKEANTIRNELMDMAGIIY